MVIGARGKYLPSDIWARTTRMMEAVALRETFKCELNTCLLAPAPAHMRCLPLRRWSRRASSTKDC